ncbi:MAG: hypothetical protein JXD19_11795, partial [Deltaproteobacteria bacterium]|nr:hypothetical protein [Deltaproteobacteria bacterium]
WETEVAVVNTGSTQTVSGEFKGYNSAGQEVGSVAMTLAPHGRREIIVGTEFAGAATICYGVFECASSEVTGCARLYVDGKWRMALPATARINAGDIFIPHIASDQTWTTEIALVNTTASSASVTIAFDNGSSKTVDLGAKEQWSSSIRNLFQGTPQGEIHSAVIENAAGIIGAELFSSGNLLSGVLIADETAAAIYYPHVVMNPATWITGIVAYNPSSVACTMTVTPYREDGTMLSPVTETIEGRGRYFGTVTGLGLSGETAWVKIESTQAITGFEAFINNNNGNQLAGYTGVNISGKEGVFPILETNGWSAATFVNLEASDARVDLRAYNDAGVQIAHETITVGPNEKYSGGITSLFSQSIAGATYIAYDSDKTVVTFQANGSGDGMMLDALQGM